MGTVKLLTVADVADALGLSEWTVRQHTRQGRFDGFVLNVGGTRHGARYRYDPKGFARWLDSQRVSAA